MNTEKFKLWKLALNVIHLDGDITPEEEVWFRDKVKFLESNSVLKFSPDQVTELEAVLHNPTTDFIRDYKELKDKKDIAFLIHLIRTISNVDDEYTKEELDTLEFVQKACLENVDLNAAEELVALDEKESYHEDEIYKVHHKASRIEKAFMWVAKILNPGDYKFPEE